jgi:signal recognition particle GTPase
MTKAEKDDAALIKNSQARVQRIARGSGCSEKDVREFLSQFEKMEKMMSMFRKNRGFRKKMEKMMAGASPDLKMV